MDNASLIVALKEANGLLRSAYCIAERDGKATNWEAFRGQLKTTLEKQHAILWPPDSFVRGLDT
jgi:hypothetical protein